MIDPIEDRNGALPPPIVVDCRRGDLASLLRKEWLLANRIGAYASSTVVGCNVRRYHGLLVAATTPPTGRVAALATVMEQLLVGETTYGLATNEFAGTFSPRGVVHLQEFRNNVAATFVYRAGPAELIKEVVLAEAANAVAVRYTLRGADARLYVRPFTALRDYHDLRKVHNRHGMTSAVTPDGLVVQERMRALPALHVALDGAELRAQPQWWYRFHYRVDLTRGQECTEDLYSPGCLQYELSDGETCQFTASLGDPVRVDFEATVFARRSRLAEIAERTGGQSSVAERRLAAATDSFLVQRNLPNGARSATILAGYHWFADWGRDAFIALPGLMLETGRFRQAREVFATFAQNIADGMVPNRFDEDTAAAHYNSIDASLWFILAGERYLAAGGDTRFWAETIMPAASTILDAYREGTRFDIRADADGLLAGGSEETQLTWMDVALGDETITPRHGKAVEINALWHSAHRIMARRCAGVDDKLSQECEDFAARIAPAFLRTFWNEGAGCLYDCVNDGTADASVRPNQILAVSLPHSALSQTQQASVLRIVKEKLLTPFGLRTLSPADARYRGRYGTSWESRDRAYHQGTVWAWLMGPFIEAHLKVEGHKPLAVAQAKKWLEPFDEHLKEAGLGFISEVFDGDPPHAPHGCIAQAWSVAEVLRAKRLVAACERQ